MDTVNIQVEVVCADCLSILQIIAVETDISGVRIHLDTADCICPHMKEQK